MSLVTHDDLRPGDEVVHGHGSSGPILKVLGVDVCCNQGGYAGLAFHVKYPDGRCGTYFSSSLWPLPGPSPVEAQ